MIDQILKNLGLRKLDDEADDVKVLSTIIPPIALFDYCKNRFREIEIPTELCNYHKNLLKRCSFNKDKFFSNLFKDVYLDNSIDLCDMFDDFLEYFNWHIIELKNNLFRLFCNISKEKRLFITELYTIFVLSEICQLYFEKVCKGKHYKELINFGITLKKLLDNLCIKYATANEVILIQKDAGMMKVYNSMIDDIVNYIIEKK